MQSQQLILAYPLTLRVGYERDIGERWALGANFVYIFQWNNVINSYYSYDEPRMESSKSRRLGFEIVGSYKNRVAGYNGTIYAGFGLSKDSGSYAIVSTQYEYMYQPYYDYGITRYAYNTNTYQIDTLYPLVKFGVMLYVKPTVGLSWELNYGWSTDKQNYINTGFGYAVLGIQFRI